MTQKPSTQERDERLYPVEAEQVHLPEIEPGLTLALARERLRSKLLFAESSGHSAEDYISTDALRTLFADCIHGPLPRVYVIDDAKKAEIVGLFEESGFPISQNLAEYGGFFHPVLDVAVVFYHPEHERRFGAEVTTSNIVHETAHAIMGMNNKALVASVHTDAVALGARTGFIAEGSNGEERNIFLEEAFAETLRLRYLHTLGNQSQWMLQLADEVQADRVEKLHKYSFRTPEGAKYPVALSGVPKEGEAFASAPPPLNALAYGIFNTLAQKVPELRTLLIHGRANIKYARMLWAIIQKLIGNKLLRRLRAAATENELTTLHKEIEAHLRNSESSE